MKMIICILGATAAVIISALILLGYLAFKVAGYAMQEFEEWRN